jgi:hypothetical protein
MKNATRKTAVDRRSSKPVKKKNPRYLLLLHASGAFENKADAPTFTKIHQTPQIYIYIYIYKSKTPREKPAQDQENQVCKRRREKGRKRS